MREFKIVQRPGLVIAISKQAKFTTRKYDRNGEYGVRFYSKLKTSKTVFEIGLNVNNGHSNGSYFKELHRISNVERRLEHLYSQQVEIYHIKGTNQTEITVGVISTL